MPINNKTLFIHIPKCGGHSVERAMGIKHHKFANGGYSYNYVRNGITAFNAWRSRRYFFHGMLTIRVFL